MKKSLVVAGKSRSIWKDNTVGFYGIIVVAFSVQRMELVEGVNGFRVIASDH